MKTINFFIIILTFCLIVACSSDEEVGNLSINFTNVVGEENLVFQNDFSKNGNESFSVDELKYIISNIVLIDGNGNEFVYPQEDSYFLINQDGGLDGQRVNLQNINANNYTSIRFGIGIDQSNYPLNGVDNFVPTAEENNMLWSWSAGYIFMKIEGKYSTNSSSDNPFRYHIGSHGENLDNYREVNLNFLQPIALGESQTPVIDINFDVLKMFSGQHEMLLEEKDDIQIDPENAPRIIDNVTEAFEIGLN